MLSNIILRSTAAFGGAPFRLKKCTSLTSAAGGAAGGGWFPRPFCGNLRGICGKGCPGAGALPPQRGRVPGPEPGRAGSWRRIYLFRGQ